MAPPVFDPGARGKVFIRYLRHLSDNGLFNLVNAMPDEVVRKLAWVVASHERIRDALVNEYATQLVDSEELVELGRKAQWYDEIDYDYTVTAIDDLRESVWRKSIGDLGEADFLVKRAIDELQTRSEK